MKMVFVLGAQECVNEAVSLPWIRFTSQPSHGQVTTTLAEQGWLYYWLLGTVGLPSGMQESKQVPPRTQPEFVISLAKNPRQVGDQSGHPKREPHIDVQITIKSPGRAFMTCQIDSPEDPTIGQMSGDMPRLKLFYIDLPALAGSYGMSAATTGYLIVFSLGVYVYL
ncbi:hypothetical protein GGR50DRAFT_645422 [Xylaria sp. CBS 124048]|nr:hypothetical protein GGR50DRAFT_645422 [Xylaria sp. CBS 124048]